MPKTKKETPKSPAPKKPSVDILEDVTKQDSLSGDSLKRITEMGKRLVQIKEAEARLQERLKELSEESERISGADLPGVMQELSLKDFTLESGDKIVLKNIVKGNLPTESAILKEQDPTARIELKTRFEQGMRYLESNGASALIKNVVMAEMGKDSIVLSKKAIAALKKLKIDATLTRGVNPNSLNAWIKERIEAGDEVDPEIFKIYTGTRAEVKTTSKAKN